MDDRFHRRDLLLHLGDVLEASSRLARECAPDAEVAQRLREDASLQEFPFLATLAAKMTVAGFCTAAVSAFSRWPTALLEIELNRDALALSVQLNLFDGHRDGWNAYVVEIQKKVPWFGVGLSEAKGNAPVEPARSVTDRATSLSLTDRGQASEKKGWPWPDPRQAS